MKNQGKMVLKIISILKKKTRPRGNPQGRCALYCFCSHAELQRLKLPLSFGELVLRDSLSAGDLISRLDHASAFDESAKPIHIMHEFRKPVVAVAVIAGIPAGVSLLVADDIFELDSRVVLHQKRAQRS